MSYLRRHGFLHLQSTRKRLDYTRQLADADHFPVREIADMDFANDRSHVVLTVRLETDVAKDNHFVVAVDFVEGAAEKLDGIVVVSAAPFFERANDASWRSLESLTVRVIADPAQQDAYRFLGFFSGWTAHFLFLASFCVLCLAEARGLASLRPGLKACNRRQKWRVLLLCSAQL